MEVVAQFNHRLAAVNEATISADNQDVWLAAQ
jgi:hypothetical protein